MERPLHPHISPFDLHRYQQWKEEDESRTKDRLNAPGMPAILARLDEKDSKVWRGDHTFNADAAQFALTNFIEPEVAKKHPSWSSEQIKSEAREQFKKRLTQDLSYERREHAHIETEVVWHSVETPSGKRELATMYGDQMVTLSELWDHTKEYAAYVGNSYAYNAEEHKAQLAMQDAFLSGQAQSFVSVLSHPDAVRYIQVWQTNDTGEVVSRQVDLYKTTGRDLTHDEGARLVAAVGDFYSQHKKDADINSTYSHVFIEKRLVNDGDIRTIAIAQTIDIHEFYEGKNTHDNSPTPDVRQVIHFTGESKGELGSTGTALITAIDAQIKRIAWFVFPDVFQKNDIKIQDQSVYKKAQPVHRVSHDVKDAKTSKVMDTVLADLVISKNFITVLPMIPVAPVAALFWFRSTDSNQMTERQNTLVQSEKARPPSKEVILTVDKHIRVFWHKIFERKERGALIPPISQATESFTKVLTKRVADIPLSIVRLLSPRLKKLEGAKKIEIGSKATDAIIIALLQEPHKPLVQSFFRLIELINNQSRILERFVDIIQKENFTTVLEKPNQSKNTGEIKDNSATVETRVVFAILVWLVLTHPVLQNIHVFESSHRKMEDEKQPADTTNAQFEPQWILLSIIWNMVMLREAGKRSNAVRIKKKTKAKTARPKRTNAPAPFGVIFAFPA